MKTKLQIFISINLIKYITKFEYDQYKLQNALF